MKRIAWISFVWIVLGSGCSVDRWIAEWSRPKPGTFRSYDLYVRSLERDTAASRMLAEDQAPVCMRDRIATAKNLQSEIERIESARGGEPLSGQVAGVALNGLNFTQGSFLKEHADLYDTSSFATAATSADCAKSLPCLLDSIYREAYRAPPVADNGPKWPAEPVGDEALLLYHWYLRTGTVLAGISSVPGLTGMDAPLARYLFNSDELRILNEVTYRIPPLYRKMWTLRSLHKVPYGYTLGGGIADASSGSFSISGQSGANGQTEWRVTSTPGYIRFFHEGLMLSRQQGNLVYDTSLRETAVHELSHELDLVIDNPGKDMIRVSESKEWTQISGWHLVSAISPSGLVFYEWKPDPAKEKFVRWYAGTDPNEDFADSAAYFRMEPSRFKDTPKKKAFISGWLYGGRTFDQAGNLDYYQSFVERELLKLIPEQLEHCQAVQDPSQLEMPSQVYVAENALGLVEVPEGLQRKCLSARLNADLDEQFRRLRYHEWEACDFLKPDVVKVIATRQAGVWASRVNQLVALGANTAGTAGRLKKSLDEFDANFDPREAYVACYGEPAPEQCYDERLERMYESWLASQPADLAEMLEGLKKLQLKESTYEAARYRSIESVNSLISGASNLAWNKTDAIWKACKDSHSEISGPPLLEPYGGGEQYVRAAILDCVNRRLGPDFRKLLISYAQGKFTWASEKALSLAVDRLHKKSHWILDLRVRRAARDEWTRWEKLYPTSVSANPVPTEGNCLETLEPKLNDWIRSLPAAQRPREDYYTREEIARIWARKRCPATEL